MSHGVTAEQEWFKDQVQPSEDDPENEENDTVMKISSLLCAAAKLLEYRTLYGYTKGDARKCLLRWIQENHPNTVIANSFRAEKGGRQDNAVEAAIELLYTRSIFYDYLEARAKSEEPRRLRGYLKRMLGSLKVVAALQARAILFDKIFEPLRYLLSSNDLRYPVYWILAAFSLQALIKDKRWRKDRPSHNRKAIYTKKFKSRVSNGPNVAGAGCRVPLSFSHFGP